MSFRSTSKRRIDPNQRVIEGHIGVEVDMGVRTDNFGIRAHRADAESLLDGLVEFLGLLPERWARAR